MATLYVCLPNSPSLLETVDTATSSLTGYTSGLLRTYCASVSPDGTLLAVVSGDGADYQGIELWSLPSMTYLPCMAVTGDPLTGIAWSPDSGRFCVAGRYNVYPFTRTGALGVPISIAFSGNARGLYNSMVYSHDGTKLFACTSDNVTQFDSTTGASLNVYALAALPGDYTPVAPSSVTLSPDGTTLYISNAPVFASPLGRLYVADVVSGHVAAPVAVSASNSSLQLTLSPDGTTLYISEPGVGVHVVNTSTLAQTTITGADASQSVLTATGQLWVTDYTHKQVRPVNLAGGTMGAPIAVTDEPFAVGAIPPPPPTTVIVAVVLGPLALAVTGTVLSGAPATITGTATLMAGPLTLDIPTTRIGLQLAGRAALRLGPVQLFAIAGRVGPGGWPVPGYRGAWRLTLHNRTFHPATLASTLIAELTEARARQLVQTWNQPATLTFTLDGQSPSAALISELLMDVVAWRWDDQTGQELAVFRGVIAQSQDTIDEQSHVVTFTCHDYAAMLARRFVTTVYTATNHDQDLIVSDLLALSTSAHSSSGVSFSPASFLPLSLLAVNPAGALRGFSGSRRDATYYGNQNIGQAVSDLAVLAGGFDFDVQPSAVGTTDSLRVFYPAQGVARTDMALQYGANVSTLTRSVDSSVYANYVRSLGNHTSTNPAVQLYAEQWTSDAATTLPAVGLWMIDDNASSETVQTALNARAQGLLALDAALAPTYTIGLTAGAYEWGYPNMGDTVPLIVQSGRLNVNTTVRVLGITYAINDDSSEDVALVVSRPTLKLADLFKRTDERVSALARR